MGSVLTSSYFLKRRRREKKKKREKGVPGWILASGQAGTGLGEAWVGPSNEQK